MMNRDAFFLLCFAASSGPIHKLTPPRSPNVFVCKDRRRLSDGLSRPLYKTSQRHSYLPQAVDEAGLRFLSGFAPGLWSHTFIIEEIPSVGLLLIKDCFCQMERTLPPPSTDRLRWLCDSLSGFPLRLYFDLQSRRPVPFFSLLQWSPTKSANPPEFFTLYLSPLRPLFQT